MAPQDRPPPIEHWPPISILVPCYNEADNAEETLTTAAAVDYPEFEVIAINDGSRDNTAEVLDQLVEKVVKRFLAVHVEGGCVRGQEQEARPRDERSGDHRAFQLAPR
jgi:biofilm PGA synthesis N-glycosyltransferase PgaC